MPATTTSPPPIIRPSHNPALHVQEADTIDVDTRPLLLWYVSELRCDDLARRYQQELTVSEKRLIKRMQAVKEKKFLLQLLEDIDEKHPERKGDVAKRVLSLLVSEIETDAKKCFARAIRNRSESQSSNGSQDYQHYLKNYISSQEDPTIPKALIQEEIAPMQGREVYFSAYLEKYQAQFKGLLEEESYALFVHECIRNAANHFFTHEYPQAHASEMRERSKRVDRLFSMPHISEILSVLGCSDVLAAKALLTTRYRLCPVTQIEANKRPQPNILYVSIVVDAQAEAEKKHCIAYQVITPAGVLVTDNISQEERVASESPPSGESNKDEHEEGRSCPIQTDTSVPACDLLVGPVEKPEPAPWNISAPVDSWRNPFVKRVFELQPAQTMRLEDQESENSLSFSPPRSLTFVELQKYSHLARNGIVQITFPDSGQRAVYKETFYLLVAKNEWFADHDLLHRLQFNDVYAQTAWFVEFGKAKERRVAIEELEADIAKVEGEIEGVGEENQRQKEGLKRNREDFDQNRKGLDWNREDFDRNRKYLDRNREDFAKVGEENQRQKEALKRNREGLDRNREDLKQWKEEFNQKVHALEEENQEREKKTKQQQDTGERRQDELDKQIQVLKEENRQFKQQMQAFGEHLKQQMPALFVQMLQEREKVLSGIPSIAPIPAVSQLPTSTPVEDQKAPQGRAVFFASPQQEPFSGGVVQSHPQENCLPNPGGMAQNSLKDEKTRSDTHHHPSYHIP